MNLHLVIKHINEKNGPELFPDKNISGLESTLSKIPKIEYIGHGVQTICFRSEKKKVIKCCLRRKNSILSSKDDFLDSVRNLLSVNLPILAPDEVLYEDEIWIVYTQPLCRMFDDVSIRFCRDLFRFLRLMIKSGIRIPDVYYKNFGIYHGRVVMFDYHEVDSFESSPNFLITNLYSNLTLLGRQIGWKNVSNNRITRWDEVVACRFGRGRFPGVFVDLLEALHHRDYNKALEATDHILVYFKQLFRTQFPLFPTIRCDDDGLITLDSPPEKYQMIFNWIHDLGISQVLDVNGPQTGIGFKLAQDLPKLGVKIWCETPESYQEAKTLISNTLTYNVNVLTGGPNNLRLNVNEQYDLVMYLGDTFVKLLQENKFSDLMRFMRPHIAHYCLIEVPVAGDHALYELSRGGGYDCLSSPYNFRAYLCLNQIKVNHCVHIDYGNSHMKRYFFLCSVGS